jgi:hypothetical protein
MRLPPALHLIRNAALAAQLLVSAAISVEAQAQGGRSGMSTADPLRNVNAFRELSAFGACFARSSRSAALDFIATEPNSRQESEIYNRYIGGERYNCHGGGSGWTQASLVYWRGVIAEGLLRSGGVPASHVLPAPALADVRDLDDVARCYAAGHAPQIRELLATPLGSQEEVAAVAALWNDFRACMPARFNVRLNAPWIRFLLAEAMLRLAPDVTLAGN